MPTRTVYATRKFPPVVGGMETLSASVWRSLQFADPESELIANRRGNKWLVVFLPYAVVRAVTSACRKGKATILSGDALTHSVLSPVLRLLRIPHATMVMGLDITHRNPVYRAIAVRQLRKAPLVLAISRATAAAALGAGVSPDRVATIRLGVALPEPAESTQPSAAARLRSQLGLSEQSVILVTVGRMVRRKGVAWFVGQVLPSLPQDVHYVIVGDGPDRELVSRLATDLGMTGRVHMLGLVDDTQRELVLRGADLFVQPNIRVPGDMEGFGLVTVESAVRGTPVVAADLEGISDAVVPGMTGWLLPPGDARTWQAEVCRIVDEVDLKSFGAQAAAHASKLFDERAMGDQLVQMLASVRR